MCSQFNKKVFTEVMNFRNNCCYPLALTPLTQSLSIYNICYIRKPTVKK